MNERQIICAMLEALGNGSAVSEDSSLEFLSQAPEEVRLCVGGLRAEVDTLQRTKTSSALVEWARIRGHYEGCNVEAGQSEHCYGQSCNCGLEAAIASTPEVDRLRVVTLCGSTRFRAAFVDAARRETMAGRIVLSPGVFSHGGDPLTDTEKIGLVDLHKRKIDMSHEILVLDVGGYVGDGTREEVAYTLAQGKPVRYLSHEHPGYVDSEKRDRYPEPDMRARAEAAELECERLRGIRSGGEALASMQIERDRERKRAEAAEREYAGNLHDLRVERDNAIDETVELRAVLAAKPVLVSEALTAEELNVLIQLCENAASQVRHGSIIYVQRSALARKLASELRQTSTPVEYSDCAMPGPCHQESEPVETLTKHELNSLESLCVGVKVETVGASVYWNDLREKLAKLQAKATGVTTVERYQKCVLALLDMFPADPIPKDDSAHFFIERLEALIELKLIGPTVAKETTDSVLEQLWLVFCDHTRKSQWLNAAYVLNEIQARVLVLLSKELKR